ncbi:MAG: type II toxin-antitoxin system VapC family toxin [Candidatus Binatus sp.]|uniref:type II toxin-antitoxin system VapC family toxin n=1 Tax=Candidatus Binatus sp. TaxID=2811406 RepID=UPI003C77656D
MKLLLDSCTFLWIVADDPHLSATARAMFRDPSNEAFLSVVSAWEIAVKSALGNMPLPEPADSYVPNFRKKELIEPLPLSEEMVLQVVRLPLIHRDPFDRLLICQAIAEGMAILTPDNRIRQYPVRTIW